MTIVRSNPPFPPLPIRAPTVVSERARLEAATARLEARRSRLLDAYADGIVSKAELAERVAPIDAELAGIVAALAVVPAAPDPDAYRDAGAVVAAMRAAVPRMDADVLAGALATLRVTFDLDDGGMVLRYGAPFDRMLGDARVP